MDLHTCVVAKDFADFGIGMNSRLRTSDIFFLQKMTSALIANFTGSAEPDFLK
jgi:hypothetical protein